MLVLKRYEGDWLEVEHVASGECFRFRTYRIGNGQLDIAFDDAPKAFKFIRAEISAKYKPVPISPGDVHGRVVDEPRPSAVA